MFNLAAGLSQGEMQSSDSGCPGPAGDRGRTDLIHCSHGTETHSVGWHVAGATYFEQPAVFPKESCRVVRALPSQGGRPSSQVAEGIPDLPISGHTGLQFCHATALKILWFMFMVYDRSTILLCLSSAPHLCPAIAACCQVPLASPPSEP